MSFVSFQFLLFFLIVTLVYFLLPNKYRWLWLLAVSYFFYMCFSPQYAVLLAAATLVTYLSG
ncbi:MAG TPA: membrane-bound O-acyltransferase family protein, partial [Ruminococcaceae bacterium]|nr:membrane-bound O-acyltransferase family protein [Oscillospiraceae bacterium]